MAELLMTSSLFGAVDWANHAPNRLKRGAEKNLASMIRRLSHKSTKAQKKGIDFEDAITSSISASKIHCFSWPNTKFKEIADMCNGGEFQKKFTKKIHYIGDDILVGYGKLDVWLPKQIIDLKTTKGYTDPYKYTGSMQHMVYCWLTGISEFTYVIAVLGEGHTDVKEVHTVDVHVGDGVQATLLSRMGHVIYNLKSRGLYDDYVKIYSRNG